MRNRYAKHKRTLRNVLYLSYGIGCSSPQRDQARTSLPPQFQTSKQPSSEAAVTESKLCITVIRLVCPHTTIMCALTLSDASRAAMGLRAKLDKAPVPATTSLALTRTMAGLTTPCFSAHV